LLTYADACFCTQEIVKYCLKDGDFRSAIEFLLIAKDNERAMSVT
jgi:hypothetical protein